jgi:hypothetical protein
MVYAGSTIDGGLSRSQIDISASRTTAVAGESVTFTARIVPSGAVTPTGSVTFLGEAAEHPTVLLGSVALDANGTASLTKNVWPGAVAVSARYAGDGRVEGARSSTVTVSVSPTIARQSR